MSARSDRPSVLITGITGGFGRAFARTYAEAGYRVLGISRTVPPFPVDRHIALDMTDPQQLETGIRKLAAEEPSLDVLINNAGIGLYDCWEDMRDTDLRRLMELNFFSIVTLTRNLLPALKAAGGSIINVSSVAGKMPVPMMGAYCVSKYAVVAYSDTLRAELMDSGAHVLNLIVGRINTGFSTRALGGKKPPRTPFGGAPDQLAVKTLRFMRRRRRQLVYPGWYRLVILLQRILPGFFDRMAMRKWRSD